MKKNSQIQFTYYLGLDTLGFPLYVTHRLILYESF